MQSEALDHPLSFRQRIGLRIHLFLCKWCNRYGRQLRFLRSAAHQQEQHTYACRHRRYGRKHGNESSNACSMRTRVFSSKAGLFTGRGVFAVTGTRTTEQDETRFHVVA